MRYGRRAELGESDLVECVALRRLSRAWRDNRRSGVLSLTRSGLLVLGRVCPGAKKKKSKNMSLRPESNW